MKILYISLLTLLLSIASAFCYRYGGWSGGMRWVRQVGVGICIILELIVLGLFNWACPLIMGSIWIESTYFKIKGEVTNLSWILIGLSFSIVLLPWLIFSEINHKNYLLGFTIRTIICTGATILWQELLSDKVAKLLNITKDITDETGRGFVQIVTLPLLLIGA